MILLSPGPPLRKLFSKVLVAVLFFAPLVSIAAIAFRAGGVMDWHLTLKAVWLAVSMAFTGASTGVLVAISYTDWEWELPKRMLKVTGRFIMLGVMGLFFAAFATLMAVTRSGGSSAFVSEAPWSVLLPVGAVAGVLTYVLVRISAERLDRMEWKV
jgi:hypothetical protein